MKLAKRRILRRMVRMGVFDHLHRVVGGDSVLSEETPDGYQALSARDLGGGERKPAPVGNQSFDALSS